MAVFERFTDRARRVLVLAQEEARLLGHSFIGTEHILLGLVHEDEGIAAEALAQSGVTLSAARAKVQETIGMASGVPAGSPPFTPRAKKVLELALREALQLGHSYIGTEHLLLGLVREGEGVAAQVLVELGADLGRVRQQVVQLMAGSAPEGTPAGGPLPPTGRDPQPAACALCGADLWDAERVVTALRVAVCDTCVRAAAALLDTAPEGQHRLTMPPRVLGEPPGAATLGDLVGALSIALSETTPADERARVVDDPGGVAGLLDRRAMCLASGPDDVRVLRVRFDAGGADVRVAVRRQMGGITVVDGRAQVREGRWVVAAATMAAALGFHRGPYGPAGTVD